MSSVIRDEAARDPLRAEHDALLSRLSVRHSIDEVRKASYLVFGGLIGTGLSIRLAWDRWGALNPGAVRKVHGGPPILLWLAMAATVVLLAYSIRSLLRARRLLREEEGLHGRLVRIRSDLGLDG